MEREVHRIVQSVETVPPISKTMVRGPDNAVTAQRSVPLTGVPEGS